MSEVRFCVRTMSEKSPGASQILNASSILQRGAHGWSILNSTTPRPKFRRPRPAASRLLHVWPRGNVEMHIIIMAQRPECEGGYNGSAQDLHGRVARPGEIERSKSRRVGRKIHRRISRPRQAVYGKPWSVSFFDGSVSGVSEVVVAFGGIDGFDQAADVSPGMFDGSLLSGTHPVFDLGESLLDRIEVG